MRRFVIALGLSLAVCAAQAGGAKYVKLPGGEFDSVLKYEDSGSRVRVAPFSLMSLPVTNADFLAFVRTHPQWKRDAVAGVFAERRYLSHWAGATALGANALPQQPVIWVSWFAASAYCKAQGARLPTWSQWEYAAAADEQRTDARADPAWRERILAWYSQSSRRALQSVGLQRPTCTASSGSGPTTSPRCWSRPTTATRATPTGSSSAAPARSR